MKREFLCPVKVTVLAGDVENEPSLLKAKTPQIALEEPDVCTLRSGSSLMLDFGKEVCGTVRILSHVGAQPCKIHLRLGESWGEACAELGEKGACNDHSLRDIRTELVNFSDMRFCQSAFRFVRIDVEEGDMRLKNIYAEGEIYEGPVQYTYTGADATLRAIYETACRTVNLCLQNDMLWDGVKRDRLVWVGDIYPELLAITTLYGRCEPLENALCFSYESCPESGFMNGFPQYSAWWLINMAEYWEQTHNDSFWQEHAEGMRRIAGVTADCVQEDGSLTCPSYFLDWPTHGQPDEYEACRALTLYCARRLKKLYTAIGWDTSVPDTMIERLEKKPIVIKTAKQAIAIKWFATGELTEEETAALLQGGAAGMSTFMSYFILEAVAGVAGEATAVAMLKEYYGAMLSRGATTFFEDFHMEWLEGSGRLDEPTPAGTKDLHGDYGAFCYVGFRHSLCHGWSTGILRFMKEHC